MSKEAITTEVLDHHRLIAAAIKDMDLIEKINSRIKQNKDPRRIVSTGASVGAFILNGLGFTNRRLYIISQFFENKPVARLLGNEKIKAEHLNDDTLGKALDEIAKYGSTRLFGEIAIEIISEHQLLGQFGRFDTSTISVEGSYDKQEGEGIINITNGHSKGHRPDLKQMTILFGIIGLANLPFWFEPLDGNKSDKKSIHQAILSAENFCKQLKEAPILTYVADSALYNSKTLLDKKNNFPWITRVPETIKETWTLLEYPSNGEKWQKSTYEKYKFYMHYSNYGGTQQRWMIVYSEKKFRREEKTFKKDIIRKTERVEKNFKVLAREIFACSEDAMRKLNFFKKKNELFEVCGEVKEVKKHISKGRPKKDANLQVIGYAIEGKVTINNLKADQLLQHKGKFILATNQLDEKILPNELILSEYKEQNSVERGFAFLKDPWFMVDSIYLKSKKRIAALMMIMTLCLLVYNFAQYRARKALRDADEFLPNQVKKPIQNPTLKWLFLMMEGVAIVNVKSKTHSSNKSLVSNLTPIRKQIISLFGASAENIYGFKKKIGGM